MINNKKIIAIIPARSGSVGCPGKNYKEIAGKPLVLWSVEAAMQSLYIDTVVVSSNCPNVFKAIDDYNWKAYENKTKGVHYLKRPDEISQPNSSTEETISHVLQCFDLHDIIVLLQPTSPARRNNLVDKCITKLVSNDCDSVFTAKQKTPFLYRIVDGKVNFLYMYENSKLVISPDIRPMRQDLKDSHHYYSDCGNVYCFYENTFARFNRRIGNNPLFEKTDFFESLQIDSVEDFDVMSALVDRVYGRFL